MDASACEGCPKHLLPVEASPDPACGKRIAFLVKLESMVNIGCKFQLDDLPVRVWDELLALALERQRMDRLVMDQKDDARKRTSGAPPVDTPEEARRLAEARKAAGVPPPGASLFGSRR